MRVIHESVRFVPLRVLLHGDHRKISLDFNGFAMLGVDSRGRHRRQGVFRCMLAETAGQRVLHWISHLHRLVVVFLVSISHLLVHYRGVVRNVILDRVIHIATHLVLGLHAI